LGQEVPFMAFRGLGILLQAGATAYTPIACLFGVTNLRGQMGTPNPQLNTSRRVARIEPVAFRNLMTVSMTA